MEPAIYDVASPWSNLWILGTAIFRRRLGPSFHLRRHRRRRHALPDGQTKPVSHRKE